MQELTARYVGRRLGRYHVTGPYVGKPLCRFWRNKDKSYCEIRSSALVSNDLGCDQYTILISVKSIKWRVLGPILNILEQAYMGQQDYIHAWYLTALAADHFNYAYDQGVSSALLGVPALDDDSCVGCGDY